MIMRGRRSGLCDIVWISNCTVTGKHLSGKRSAGDSEPIAQPDRVAVMFLGTQAPPSRSASGFAGAEWASKGA